MSRSFSIVLLAACVLCIAASAHAADDPPPTVDSPLVKLLKSGRVPEARQGTVIEMVGKRGTVGDLDYIYQQAIAGRFSPAIRIKALEALAEAALTRDMKPGLDRNQLMRTVPGNPEARRSARAGESGGPARRPLEARKCGRPAP